MRVEFGDTRLPERFWDKIQVVDSGCWKWTAGVRGNGYGGFSWRGQTYYTHRLTYAMFRESIPKGLECDHLCRNRLCCHPEHLELVTRQVNTRRGAAATHARGAEFCRTGKHLITPDNVYTCPDGNRRCRACRREGYRRRRRRSPPSNPIPATSPSSPEGSGTAIAGLHPLGRQIVLPIGPTALSLYSRARKHRHSPSVVTIAARPSVVERFGVEAQGVAVSVSTS